MTRLLALLLLLVPFRAHADPALFVARAPGITAYLLGSVHALHPGTEWQTPAIGQAFDDSSECWFELVIPKDLAAQSIALLMRGLDPQGRLPALLGPADHARLQKEAAALQVPGGAAMLDKLQPWMAYMLLEASDMKAAGLDGEGVDQVLQHQAQDANKAVVGFETLDQQVGFIAGQPEPTMLHLLHGLLATPPTQQGDGLDKLVRAWMAGDVPAVARMMNDTERALGPSVADVLLLRRNKAWAERLDGLRDSGKTILVTVGAGHLAGPGNLRDELQRRHFTVERVQPPKDTVP